MYHQHQILIDHITKNDMPISYRMTKRAAFDFICDIDRYEAIVNTTVWIKAVRCVLLNFGFDPDWVNNDFYDLMIDFYRYEPNLNEEDE